MTTFRFPNGVENVVTRLLFVAFITLNFALTSAIAGESTGQREQARVMSLSPLDTSDFVLSAHPAVGKVNQTRTIFLRFQPPGGCVRTYVFSLDTSLVETQRLLVIRTQGTTGLCGLLPPPNPVRAEFEFAPTITGTITILWDGGGADATLQTVAAPIGSKFETNGMWFDAATNGSGVALHHSRATTDIAFGTWFLFNNNGESRWYTFQFANWQQDGSVLEGLLIQTRGGCSLTSVAACPAAGTFRTEPPQNVYWVMPSLARITFQSSTRARAEVFSLGGAALFASELSKIQF